MLYRHNKGNYQKTLRLKIGKQRYLPNCCTERGNKGIIVNLTCHSPNSGSLEIPVNYWQCIGFSESGSPSNIL